MSRRPERLRNVDTREDFDRVIEAATRVQRILPDAVLVGRTASAIHCSHRFSRDDDHVIKDLKDHYDEVLTQLEQMAGWQTNRWTRPVVVLGSLDGVDTGIRNLIRSEPLETTVYDSVYGPVTLPTLAEMARIKAALILRRNATRDFIDFVALVDRLRELDGDAAVNAALLQLDRLYPQSTGESPVRQLAKQLAEPKPYDLGDGDLSKYRLIAQRFRSWHSVRSRSLEIAADLEIARNRHKPT